jgi:hypothetical protein
MNGARSAHGGGGKVRTKFYLDNLKEEAFRKFCGSHGVQY